jgi:hypothetical protein
VIRSEMRSWPSENFWVEQAARKIESRDNDFVEKSLLEPLSTNHMLGLLNLLNLTECIARFNKQ